MSKYSGEFEKYKKFVNRHFRYDYSMFEIPKNSKLLDVGFGFGDRIELFESEGYSDVFGIDMDEYMIQKAQDKGLNVTLGSIEDTGLEAARFDVVIVENVFHHIELYEKALDELHRILKLGGTLCFVEPRFSIFRNVLDFVTFKTPTPKLLKCPWELHYSVMIQEMESGMYPFRQGIQVGSEAPLKNQTKAKTCLPS